MNTHTILPDLDLDVVKQRLKIKLNWDDERIARTETEYRGFLTLCARPDKDFSAVPSVDVDEMWHAHILYTRKYREDCMGLFGRIIDHSPASFDATPDEKNRMAVNGMKTWAALTAMGATSASFNDKSACYSCAPGWCEDMQPAAKASMPQPA